MDLETLIYVLVAGIVGGLYACLLLCALYLNSRPPQRRHTLADGEPHRAGDTDDLPYLLRRQGM